MNCKFHDKLQLQIKLTFILLFPFRNFMYFLADETEWIMNFKSFLKSIKENWDNDICLDTVAIASDNLARLYAAKPYFWRIILSSQFWWGSRVLLTETQQCTQLWPALTQFDCLPGSGSGLASFSHLSISFYWIAPASAELHNI